MLGLDRIMRLTSHGRAGGAAWGAIVLGFVLSFGVGTYLGGEWPAVRAQRVLQPVSFNHRVHVEEEGMDCLECHRHYETETFSGFPNAGLCSLCHQEALGESAHEARLVELLQEGKPLDWMSLFEQPSHVFYSHRRHVTVAGIECQVCHPGIGESSSPPEHGKPLEMEVCMDCHRETDASTECTACHR